MKFYILTSVLTLWYMKSDKLSLDFSLVGVLPTVVMNHFLKQHVGSSSPVLLGKQNVFIYTLKTKYLTN